MTINHENLLRRELAGEGLRLWKVREDSQHYLEYGPFSVVDDSTGMVLMSGATFEQAREWFNG